MPLLKVEILLPHEICNFIHTCIAFSYHRLNVCAAAGVLTTDLFWIYVFVARRLVFLWVEDRTCSTSWVFFSLNMQQLLILVILSWNSNNLQNLVAFRISVCINFLRLKGNLNPTMIFSFVPCKAHHVCHVHLIIVQNFNVFHILICHLLPFPGPLDSLFPLHKFCTIGHMCDLECGCSTGLISIQNVKTD